MFLGWLTFRYLTDGSALAVRLGYFTQSLCTNRGSSSPGIDPSTPSVWQDSSLSTNLEAWNGLPDWHTAMQSLRLQRLLWIYCPGHAGVSGIERADRLASTADITCGLQLGRAEVLGGLRNFLNMDRPEHHSIDRLKERGSGERKRPTFPPPRPRTICVQSGKYWHCFEGRLLRDGAERVWPFPSATMPSRAEAEAETEP